LDESGPYDLFVSYAHVDNEGGWIRQFVAKLGGALAIRNGGKPLNIYFDIRRVRANNVLQDMLAAARNSRLFLVVGSRAYVSNERATVQELAAFNDAARDPSRLFVIETLPLRPGEDWPKAIAHHTRQPFFVRDEDDDTESTLTLETDSGRYMREVNKLAEQIVRKLGNLSSPAPASAPAQRAEATVHPPPASLAPGFERKRVLIAQPTEMLDDAAEELREYLTKFGEGLEVLPQAPYPQGGAEFKAAYLLDLDRADLVVQLLDRRPGRRPPDLPEGYSMFQWNAAR
jgi:hypothetical protein